MKWIASAAFGLEGMTGRDLKRLGAENVRGWLAFTYDAGAEREGTGSVFGNATYYRQNTPCYPYVDMVDTFSSFFGSRSFLRSVHYVI